MPSPPGCEVDLRTKTIRFFGCEDQQAMISAVEKRLALVTSQLRSRSGLTNRERRALSNEGNVLRRWLSTEFETPDSPEVKKSLNNLRYARRKKPTKRRARKARQLYSEQHTHLQRRPDYNPPPVITLDQLELMRRLWLTSKVLFVILNRVFVWQ